MSIIYGQNGGDLPILNDVYLSQDLRLENATLINSKRSEFSPMYYKDGLVYVGNYRTGENEFFQLWYAELEDGRPQSVRPLKIQTDTNLHEGPVCFTPAGKEMFFTQSNISNGEIIEDQDLNVTLKINRAVRDFYGVWGQISELPFNSNQYSTCHPTWDNKRKRLIFSSNRPGGEGKMDLYMSDYTNGTWTEPVNVGPQLNSINNEIFPYYHESGFLFFVSDRKEGFGGFDIYMAEWKEGGFTQPTILTAPLNTKYDDFGLVLNATATSGYFSSNRKKGRGQDDIYFLQSDISLLGLQAEETFENVTIKVIDSTKLVPIESANVFMFPLPQDIINESDLFEVAVEAPESNASEFRLRYQLKKDINKDKLQLTTDVDGRLRTKYKSEQRYLFQVEKSGYYAIQHLVDMQEISDLDGLVFYMQPIVSNISIINVRQSDGTSIKDVDVLIRNASTDEQLMGRTDDYGSLQIGLVDADIYMITVRKNGYVTENAVGKGIELGNLQIEMDKVMSFEDVATDRFDGGNNVVDSAPVIVLEDIYYDLDDYTIKPEYAYELRLLAELLKRFPDIRIELIAHTDARGSDTYNLNLSVKRAETAKQFLVDLGVDAQRVESRGVGESQLRNHCADNIPCNEDEHKYNRRTEVKVIED